MSTQAIYAMQLQDFIDDLAGQLTTSSEIKIINSSYPLPENSNPFTAQNQDGIETVNPSLTTASPPDPPGHLLTGLGILIIFLSVAIVIVIIAIVVSKMRNDEKARKAKPEVEVEVEVEVVDPYKQAVQFPQDPKQTWPDYLKQSFKQAGKKIMGKEDPPHRTTIPEHLRHQLKHIYVY